MSFNRNRNETEVKFRLDFLESEARLYNIHNLENFLKSPDFTNNY
jgi:hypothetical protein